MIDSHPTAQEIAQPYWLATPFGERVLSWETTTLRRMTSTIYAMTALSMGLPIEGLQTHAISGVHIHGLLLPPDRPSLEKLALEATPKDVNVLIDAQALPFHAGSLDLIMAHHVLEMHDEPEALLREWNRVLRMNGHLVLTLFNPHSALRYASWMHQQFSQRWLQLTAGRLRDWLQLLGLSVEQGAFGVYSPPWQQFPQWLDCLPGVLSLADKHHRLDQWDSIGDRWWPSYGAVMIVIAQKRTLRLTRVAKVRPWRISPQWQNANFQINQPESTAINNAPKRALPEIHFS